jgi:hypothetical protein
MPERFRDKSNKRKRFTVPFLDNNEREREKWTKKVKRGVDFLKGAFHTGSSAILKKTDRWPNR